MDVVCRPVALPEMFTTLPPVHATAREISGSVEGPARRLAEVVQRDGFGDGAADSR